MKTFRGAVAGLLVYGMTVTVVVTFSLFYPVVHPPLEYIPALCVFVALIAACWSVLPHLQAPLDGDLAAAWVALVGASVLTAPIVLFILSIATGCGTGEGFPIRGAEC